MTCRKSVCRRFAALCLLAPWMALPAAAQPSGESLNPVTVRATAHFDSGRSVILPADQARLLADVAALKDVSWQTVTAVGHADSVGSGELNQRLSERRADAVKAYLVKKGLDAGMIHIDARGENEPIADNESAEGRRQNRRTEVVFEGVRANPR
jgi:OmpA-OmpF porin, OOP family